MPKKHMTISKAVMDRIRREHVSMRPKWYFIAGSIALAFAVIGSILTSAFVASLIAFSWRTHGPMGEIRFQQLLASFPWWAPILLVVGLGTGILLLRAYDFSYKKNFAVIVLTLIFSVLLAGWLIDSTGLDVFWSRQRGLNRIYRSIDGGYGNNGNRGMRMRHRIDTNTIQRGQIMR